MRLSQGHLKLLADCPRKFQHNCLEHLEAVTAPDQQQAMTWGKQFHQCVEQWSLGLQLPSLNDDPLGKWWRAFEQIQSTLETLNNGAKVIDRHSEFEQSLPWQDHHLVGIYDLLLLGQDTAEILDWKTYARPKDPHRLKDDWQTRLYLFLLTEATGLEPEGLGMTYWFLGGNAAQSWRLPYDRPQHQATQSDLEQLLAPLSRWLHHYPAQPFPQIDPVLGRCVDCRFNRRCDRLPLPPEIQSAMPSLAEIPEVTLQ